MKSAADGVMDSNKLKEMKKYYPEAYFKRSGYAFESFDNLKKNMIYFNK